MKDNEYKDVYRVMYKSEDFSIHYKKFNSEDDAKQFYYSIERPNRVRELDIIHNCRYQTLLWELL